MVVLFWISYTLSITQPKQVFLVEISKKNLLLLEAITYNFQEQWSFKFSEQTLKGKKICNYTFKSGAFVIAGAQDTNWTRYARGKNSNCQAGDKTQKVTETGLKAVFFRCTKPPARKTCNLSSLTKRTISFLVICFDCVQFKLFLWKLECSPREY